MTLSDATLSYFKGHKLLEKLGFADFASFSQTPTFRVESNHLSKFYHGWPLCEFLAYFVGNTDYLETVHSIRNIKSLKIPDKGVPCVNLIWSAHFTS